MISIYLAARYGRIEELREYRDELESLRFEVTSEWLKGFRRVEDAQLGKSSDPAAVERARNIARADLEDVRRADIVISFTEPRREPTRGGRHVELGAAFAWGKRCMVVGPAEHVFHRLPGIEIYPDWPSCVAALPGWDNRNAQRR